MRTKSIYPLLRAILLAGCIPFPARTVMPLKTQVIDADSGEPVAEAKVLRIVCDIHDYSCQNAKINWGKTDREGNIEMTGRRKWGRWVPAPGGMPVPNHQIAIWKKGYEAFVFSQYGTIEDIKFSTKRADLLEAIEEIPKERRKYTVEDNPHKLFLNGKMKLYGIKQKPANTGPPSLKKEDSANGTV